MVNSDTASFLAVIERCRPDWHRLGACRGSDVNFVSRSPKERSKAVGICGTCPSMMLCRAWADEVGDTWAVLGGEDPQARRLRQSRTAA